MLAVWFRCRIYSVLLPRYTTSLTTTLSASMCSTRFVMGRSKLKSLCRTRWLQRIDALQIFVDLFDSIINSFDQVTNNPSNWSRDSLVDATSLSKAMLNFDFIVTLHLVERYMSYTESLTKSLQASALNIIQAVKHIGTVKQVLKGARSNIDTQFFCHL